MSKIFSPEILLYAGSVVIASALTDVAMERFVLRRLEVLARHTPGDEIVITSLKGLILQSLGISTTPIRTIHLKNQEV